MLFWVSSVNQNKHSYAYKSCNKRLHYIFPLVKKHGFQNEMLNQKARLETLKLITSTNRKPHQKLLTWNHNSYSHQYHTNFYQQRRADCSYENILSMYWWENYVKKTNRFKMSKRWDKISCQVVYNVKSIVKQLVYEHIWILFLNVQKRELM